MGSKRFPLFISLEGRSVVVVGGGNVGLRRAAVLRRFGAEVTVISPLLMGPADEYNWIVREYVPGDLSGAYLAVAATNDPEVNTAVGREAREAGALFNRSDCQSDCDFFFPAICEGDGLVAGLAGDGSDHKKTALAARKIRAVLEHMEDDQ